MAASPYEVAAGFTFPGVFGTMATAYFAKYGATREALFNVTIKSHNNAPLNPKAQFPMTVRDFMNARIERCQEERGARPRVEGREGLSCRPCREPAGGLAHASL